MSAGSTASVAIAATTVVVEVMVGVPVGGDGGGELGGRCVHRNRCLRVKAAYSICHKGSDYGGGGGGGGLVVGGGRGGGRRGRFAARLRPRC